MWFSLSAPNGDGFEFPDRDLKHHQKRIQASRFTYESAVPQFAAVGRILNPELEKASDEEAAHRSCEAIDRFIDSVGMRMTLKDVKMPEEQIPALAKQSMV